MGLTNERANLRAEPVFAQLLGPDDLLRKLPAGVELVAVLDATVELADHPELGPVEIRVPDEPLRIVERYLQQRRWEAEQVHLHAADRLADRTRQRVSERQRELRPRDPRKRGHTRDQSLETLLVGGCNAVRVPKFASLGRAERGIDHADRSREVGVRADVDDGAGERGDGELIDRDRVGVIGTGEPVDTRAGSTSGCCRSENVDAFRPGAEPRQPQQSGRRVVRKHRYGPGDFGSGEHTGAVPGVEVEGVPDVRRQVDPRTHAHEFAALDLARERPFGACQAGLAGELELWCGVIDHPPMVATWRKRRARGIHSVSAPSLRDRVEEWPRCRIGPKLSSVRQRRADRAARARRRRRRARRWPRDGSGTLGDTARNP